MNMNTNVKDTRTTLVKKYMEKVKEFSRKFMERHYQEEVLYFDILWEIFEEVITEKSKSSQLDLDGPAVRLDGDDSIMGPLVLQAFYTLYSEIGKEIESSDDLEALRDLMIETLSIHKFAPEFSKKITDFVLESDYE